jgi:4-amino-4-deoxy-L-arabinose transferase-like glycosyltransferase
MTCRALIRSPLLWIALGLGSVTHFVYMALDHDYYGIDTPSYLIPAANLLHGQGLVDFSHQPELRRTPGYPLLLLIFLLPPLRLEYLILLQHALCALLVAATAVVVESVSGSRLTGLITAVVLAFDFATLRIANLLLTEIVFTVLIAIMVWCLYRGLTKTSHNTLLINVAGVLGGCATLVRPVGVLYFAPLSVFLFLMLKRRRVAHSVAFLAAFSFLPLLWAARNYIEGSYCGVSTIGAESLLYYRAAGALAVSLPGKYLANVSLTRQQLIDHTCGDLEHLYGKHCSQITESQRASYASHKGLNIIRGHPWGYAKSVSWSIVYMVLGGGTEAISRVTHVNPRTAAYFVLLVTVPGACLAIIGVRYWYRIDRNLCYLVCLTLAYFFATSAGAEAYSRFRVPVMPMYALLIAGGAASIVQTIRRTRASRVALPALPTEP